MATVAEHYEGLLADHYTRMFGDFAAKVAEQRALFTRLGVAPVGSAQAVDLGCGSGFQAIALAELGFQVRAVDLSGKLLSELNRRKGALPVETVQGDICDAAALVPAGTEIAVCMGDTLTHLDSKAGVERMLEGCARRLSPGGRLVLTFRDLTVELEGLDRFLPVQSSDDFLMTCFLDYEPETVKVHDLIHTRNESGGWTLSKSFYRKLRLAPDWVAERLAGVGLTVTHRETARGLVTMVARA